MFLGSLLALAAMASAAAAQYQAIPNFTGIGAGFNFRQAINQRFSGAQAIAPQIVGLTFANLPAEQDGLLLWCKNCQAVNPCGAGGAGAWAMGSRGAWACAPGALEQDLNANGHNIVAAASVKTEQPGDAQYRELMVPGNGIKVGNGATAPFTVVDEGANISGHVNGVISVKAPPYLAKGDGTTDDAAAIQAAINAACADSSNKPEVYLPATPGASYKITSPLLIKCALKFTGAGWQQTQITQNYFGPTIIAQEAETGWKPPLTSSISVTWAASHSYAQYADILDSNGNVEVQEAAACTSGSGSHPAWPTSQPNTVSDGTCTWALATTGGQANIATGSGGSLDTADPEFFNGAGYGGNNAAFEIGNPADLETYINGLSHFTLEFYAELFADDGGNYDNYTVLQFAQGAPETANTQAVRLLLNGSGCTGGSNCVGVVVDIGGSAVSFGGSGANDRLAENVIHHVALTYDGSTVQLWIDGQAGPSHSASGNLTIPPYTSMPILGSGSGSAYPAENGSVSVPGFFDSLRISNIARYTSTFTPPTTKLTSDANTEFLLNFPTGTPTGTTEGLINNSKNAFIPIETSNGAADLNPVYIGNMQLADDGIWAAWMLNSIIENITDGPYAGRTCINLHDNDYQDTIRRVACTVIPGVKTNVGFLFLNASNNNLYDHLQCDGQYTCIEQATGNGTYILPDYTDRGYVIYPFVNFEGQALYDSPTTDVEDSDTGFKADIYSIGAAAQTVINGGQLGMPSGGGPAWLEVNGGKGFAATGAEFLGSPTELLNVDNAPTSVSTIRDSTMTVPSLLTNTGNTNWLRVMQGSRDLGMKFADLPGTVTNGVRRYCVDCDPPANPPVACTSAGTKTGAWIDGLNNTWVCVP